MRAYAGGARRAGGTVEQPRADRVGEPDMGDEARTEEAALAALGAVDELVDRDEIAGRQLLLERADCRDRQHVGDAATLQDVDVGAIVDLRGREPVPFPVPRDEGELDALQRPHGHRSRRLAERAGNRDVLRFVEAQAIIEPRAADHSDVPAGHARDRYLGGMRMAPSSRTVSPLK